MTIRNYVKLRAFLARVGGWVFVVAILVVVLGYARQLSFSRRSAFFYVVGAVALVVVGFLWVLERQLIRCPRCDGSLYTLVSIGRANSCPHCGVSFDEAYRP
jgi:hypothetical protein